MDGKILSFITFLLVSPSAFGMLHRLRPMLRTSLTSFRQPLLIRPLSAHASYVHNDYKKNYAEARLWFKKEQEAHYKAHKKMQFWQRIGVTASALFGASVLTTFSMAKEVERLETANGALQRDLQQRSAAG